MDRDRYKNLKKKLTSPVRKRSINAGEQPSVVIKPTVVSSENQPVKSPVKASIQTAPLKQSNISKEEVAPTQSKSLLDDKQEDIFGVWQSQKAIKRRQKAEKAAKKAEKKARKEAIRAASGNKGGTTIAIALSVPSASKIRKSAVKLYNPRYKKRYIIGGALVMVPLTVIVVGAIISSRNHNNGDTTDVLGQTATVDATPDFSTLKPTTSDNQATDFVYNPDKKVLKYDDILDDIRIVVNQQPLPSEFQSDPTGKVEALAAANYYKDKISTSDTTAFSGMSVKGSQTVIFTKNNLLVFISADRKIDTLKWSKYIESMH